MASNFMPSREFIERRMESKAEIEEAVTIIKNLKAGVTGIQMAKAMSIIENHRDLNSYFRQYIGRTLQQYAKFVDEPTSITPNFVIPPIEETPEASILVSRFEDAQSWGEIYNAFKSDNDDEENSGDLGRAFERIMRHRESDKSKEDNRSKTKDQKMEEASEAKAKVSVRKHFRKMVEKTLETVNGYARLMQEAHNFELLFVQSLWKRVALDNLLLFFAGVPVQEIVTGTTELFQAMQHVKLGNQNMLQLFGSPQPLFQDTVPVSNDVAKQSAEVSSKG
jgi:hypothetical protein